MTDDLTMKATPIGATMTISPEALCAFEALSHAYRKVSTTFSGRFATTAKRDEAIAELTKLEAQARATRVLLRANRTEQRKTA